MPATLSVSVVIATAFRDRTLTRTLEHLARQTLKASEVVVVDGAPEPGCERIAGDCRRTLALNILYMRAAPPSAAVQRNVGVQASSGDVVVFLDDDVYLEADAIQRLVAVFENDRDRRIGGVGVLISNQLCLPPSRLAKKWFDFLADERRPSYSGMIIGPAVAIGPEPTPDPEIVPAEWLMSTCVAYRRTALPAGPFNSRFHGYSYMEDVDLSVRVARQFELVVHTGIYVYHDSQPSTFKAPYIRAKMIVQNRYYVMTVTLGRRTIGHHLRFLFAIAVPQLVSLRDVRRPDDFKIWVQSLSGTLSGLFGLVAH